MGKDAWEETGFARGDADRAAREQRVYIVFLG